MRVMIARYNIGMKFVKYLIFGVVILTATTLLFWRQIAATAGYFYMSEQMSKNNAATILPIPYTLSTSTFNTVSEITVDNLQLPVLFEEISSQIGSSSHVVRGEKMFIWIMNNPIRYRESVLPREKYTDIEYEAMCNAFSLAGRIDACSSEFNFFKAKFSTSPERTRWFSSVNEKVGFSSLGLLKIVYLTGRTESILEFSHQSARGFILPNQDKTNVVLFLENGEIYDMIFTGYTQAEIDYTLANIEVIE